MKSFKKLKMLILQLYTIQIAKTKKITKLYNLKLKQ